ncbi:ATP-binding cassette domain-containing protein [Rhodococcus sp. 008]|uniref:ATP-binding cassette domain-containing protein n=1 Tax=Rhodococcus sp. 008 TaxID=1723645 RepID=UPI0022B2561E|nr:ATP-binding cassette domain-containing protein [Rhodococcus sp. 008]
MTSSALDDVLTHLPDGHLSEVGEQGKKLSGGQRQRLLLARALHQPQPILVLHVLHGRRRTPDHELRPGRGRLHRCRIRSKSRGRAGSDRRVVVPVGRRNRQRARPPLLRVELRRQFRCPPKSIGRLHFWQVRSWPWRPAIRSGVARPTVRKVCARNLAWQRVRHRRTPAFPSDRQSLCSSRQR